MWRDVLEKLEKARIVLDRIDYANEILGYPKTSELFEELNSLLDGEVTSGNYAQIVKFLDENVTTIHAFDVEAMSVTEALQNQEIEMEIE